MYNIIINSSNNLTIHFFPSVTANTFIIIPSLNLERQVLQVLQLNPSPWSLAFNVALMVQLT